MEGAEASLALPPSEPRLDEWDEELVVSWLDSIGYGGHHASIRGMSWFFQWASEREGRRSLGIRLILRSGFSWTELPSPPSALSFGFLRN